MVIPTFETNPDAGSIDAGGNLPIDVVANDTVSEGTPYIAFINGAAVAPGGTVTLPSGALIRLGGTWGDPYPDNELVYDPNGAFDDIGLSQALDTFTYQLAVTSGFGPYLFADAITDGAFGLEFSSPSRIAGLADVNGDGMADILLSESTADDGTVRVVYGSSFGIVGTGAPDGVHSSFIIGRLRDALGSDVASAGDVNGDGIDDLFVSASLALRDSHAGQAYVVFGDSDGFGANFSLLDLNGVNGFRIVGPSADAMAGQQIAGTGDFNGDGLGDLLISAESPTTSGLDAYLVFGRPAYGSTVRLSNITGSNGAVLTGGDWLGSMTFIGDVNDDGFDDIAVSAAIEDSTYVLFGHASGLPASIDLTTLAPTQGARLTGPNGSFAGFSVAAAGDINGDGIDDFVIGAPERSGYSSNQAYAGGAYVVFGTSGGGSLPTDLALLDGTNGFRIDNNTVQTYGLDTATWMGHRVAGAGDVNGDGLDDVVVLTNSEAVVIYGSMSGFAAVIGTSELNGANGFIYDQGASSVNQVLGDVVGGQDINGDGFDDIVVQNPYLGRTHIIFGRESTVELSAAETVQVTVGGNGTEGDDHLIGLDLAETADVLAGDDYVEGRGGDDVLYGNTGNDRLLGGSGNDMLFGQDGADTLYGNEGDDFLDGGLGNNKLVGAAGDDELTGRTGADVILGQSGSDRLVGGGGDDVLEGGTNRDRLNGGDGADTFRYRATDFSANPQNSRDIIFGFAQGSDKISLALIDAVAGGGDNAFTFVGNSAFSGSAGELRYTHVDGRTLIQGDWDGDGISNMDIFLQGTISLAATDFVL